MSWKQSPIILDAELPLYQRKRQVTQLSNSASQYPIERHDVKFHRQACELPQKQAVTQEEQTSGQQSSNIAFHRFIRADLGDTPVFPKKYARKIGSDVGSKGAEHRQQH